MPHYGQNFAKINELGQPLRSSGPCNGTAFRLVTDAILLPLDEYPPMFVRPETFISGTLEKVVRDPLALNIKFLHT